MKKINVLLVLGLAVLLGLVISCEQESLQKAFSPTTNEVENRNAVVISNNVLLDGDMMNFADEISFEDFMHYLDSVGVESFLALVNSYGFTSYCNPVTGVCVNTAVGNELDQPELTAILNEYSMVHIGDHIMKLDFEEEEVYVLPDDATVIEVNQLQTAENVQDLPSSAQIIPFEENVFDIINGNTGGGQQNFSICDGAREGEDSSRPDPNNSQNECNSGVPNCGFLEGVVTARYNRAGIWFRLTGRFEMNSGGCPFRCFERSYSLSIDGDWNRCGPGNLGSQMETYTGNDCKEVVVLFGGRRRLKSYDLSVSATYECGGNTISTGTARISG